MKFWWLVVSLLLAIPALGQSGSEASRQIAPGNEKLPHYEPANGGDRVKWFAYQRRGR
jgi:hypothetical protein